MYTVSRFTDAASLEIYCQRLAPSIVYTGESVVGLPSVVVISVNVEDLLALDTQNTIRHVSQRRNQCLDSQD